MSYNRRRIFYDDLYAHYFVFLFQRERETTTIMTRDEMINKLHNICAGTRVTWLPDECALECEYVTSKGTYYQWTGQNDWPAYELHGITKENLDNINDKLNADSLVEDDLKGTELQNLWNCYYKINHQYNTPLNICSFFNGLKQIELSKDKTLYVMVDYSSENDPPKFYTDYKSFEKAFISYIGTETKWEDFSDDELDLWVNQIEDYEKIKTTIFSDEDG